MSTSLGVFFFTTGDMKPQLESSVQAWIAEGERDKWRKGWNTQCLHEMKLLLLVCMEARFSMFRNPPYLSSNLEIFHVNSVELTNICC